MSDIRCVNTLIFDMDGTVLDTLADLTVSMNHVMDIYNMPEHTEEEYRMFFGNGIRYALEKAVPEGTSVETVDRMQQDFKKHYDAHCLDRTKPYEGIPELLAEYDRRGYKLAIVSNKIDSAVKELNERFFYPSVKVAIGERKGIKRKPAPDTVFEALKELGSAPEEAVYIGDSEVDYMTAKNAGLPCISVLWGFRSREYLESIGAGIFVEKPDDIPGIIQTEDR
ncbi:MAG: HAD family hydrolase [Lachnospiraceae bacterium]|nr:HAD family hydrolase [Lachnospiraceae bacterium]